jgi:hypothetical protein
MEIRKPRSWLAPLWVVSILLVAAGWVMVWTHIPALRVPGRVMGNTGRWVSIPLFLALGASRTSQTLRREPHGTSSFWLLAQHVQVFAFGVGWALLFLVAQGNVTALGGHAAHVNSEGWLPFIESYALVWGLLYALLFAPEIVRRKLPFEHAHDQVRRLVPAVLATLAMLVTGSYLLALHFFNEPLARIPPGPLAASILAVMALLAPLYQLIARASWRYGLADLLDPEAWWAKWSEVKDEITNYQAMREAVQEQFADAKDGTESASIGVKPGFIARMPLLARRRGRRLRLGRSAYVPGGSAAATIVPTTQESVTCRGFGRSNEVYYEASLVSRYLRQVR